MEWIKNVGLNRREGDQTLIKRILVLFVLSLGSCSGSFRMNRTWNIGFTLRAVIRHLTFFVMMNVERRMTDVVHNESYILSSWIRIPLIYNPFYMNLYSRITIYIKKIIQSYFCHKGKRKRLDDFLYTYVYVM